VQILNRLQPEGTPLKILVIKPSALGDIVHSLPFLDSVKRRFPEARVHWVVARGLHEILEDHPLISRLWVIDKDHWKKAGRAVDTFRVIRKLSRELRAERFDFVVDLQGLLRSGLIAFSTGSAVRVGFSEAREGSRFFYSHRVRGGRDVHAVQRYLKAAHFLGCPEASATEDLKFPFPVAALDSAIRDSLPDDYVVVAPSAGGDSKRWPAERFGRLAARLPFRSVIIASRADARIAEEVAAFSRGKAVSLAGKTTIPEMAAVIKGAKFLVCNDTGPMHIAAALNVPVFALFGPTNPVRTGPFGAIHTIIREELSCSPCYRRKKCRNWRCMEGLSVEKVMRIIAERS
jgi:heptosyltransferase I